MRILMVHEDRREPGQGGGAESLLRDQSTALKARGHEVAWLSSAAIARAVDTFQPDIVHVGTIHNFIGFGPVQWLQANHVPHVWALMDYWPFCGPRMMLVDGDRSCPAVGGECGNSCGQAALPEWRQIVNGSYVIALNQYTADIYRRNGIRCDGIVELGVDTELFAPGTGERTGIMTSTAWPTMPVKGMHIVKAAVAGTQHRVQLVTGQPRARVAEALKRFAMFVFPSCYEETWGLCLNEAMASGLACVSSDVAGARAQIEPWVTGILIPPRDPQALREALDWMVGNPERSAAMGMAAREHVVAEHSLDAMGKRFETQYQAVLR